MEKEVIDLYNLRQRVNDDKEIDINDILIRLPNDKIITWYEYVHDDWNQKYDITSNHTDSPMKKRKIRTPDGFGSKSKKKRRGYWEDM